MTALEAIQVLNGLLILGQNFLPAAQRVSKVLETSISNGNAPIPDDDWRWAIDQDTENMAELKQAIADAKRPK